MSIAWNFKNETAPCRYEQESIGIHFLQRYVGFSPKMRCLEFSLTSVILNLSKMHQENNSQGEVEYMTLGNNIKKYRHDLGITQEELAGILCVTRQAVSKWESGASLPEVTRIVPLAQALKCSFSAHTTKGKTFKEKEIQNVIYMLSQMFNLSEG